MSERLLTAKQVMERLAITSRTTLAKLQREGGLPKPVPIFSTGRSMRWREGDIDRYILELSIQAGNGEREAM